MMNKKVELLAPAGNLEKLKWAFLYGADAVYIGGKEYSLRANASNFSLDEIKEAVCYAHNLNKRIYVTVNIVFHNDDVIKIKDYLKKLNEIGVDAIIFSDPLVIDIAKEEKFDFELHLSTQSSVLNKDSALYFKNLGVKRIVLARECNKNEIENIIKETNMEIECFIHGAMCSNISGKCVLSNYFTNRDANRGGCCQVCRFNFDLFDNNKNKISSNQNFSLASKDLSMINYIDNMIKIGVSSFKIEGRMRSIYYVSTIISVYRKIIDLYCNNIKDDEYIIKASKILNRCANRDVAPQFFDKKISKDEQYYLSKRQEDSNQDFLAVVLDYDNINKRIIVEQRNYFKKGDFVNIFSPDMSDFTFEIENMYNENDERIDVARHPGEIIKIDCDKKIMKNSLMRVNFLD